MRRFLITQILLLLLFCVQRSYAQTDLHRFVDPSTAVVTSFWGALDIQDSKKVIEEGHRRAFGSMQNEAKAHELSLKCMKPLLIADLPESGKDSSQPRVARLTLFDFSLSKECTAGFKYQEGEAVAGGVAQAIGSIPNGQPIGPPLWFDWGVNKLHLYVVALPQDGKPVALIATATLLFKDRMLGWMLMADSPATFNDFGKIEIELEPGRKYTLPFHVSNN